MNCNDGIKYNKKYKDTLFRFLFGTDKKAALSLYNAVNGSDYENEEDLEFTTLDDVIYMKMKNDLSFLFMKTLSLYEHQSSYNPNMPLRGLLYFADLYRKATNEDEGIYGQRLLKIPTPKYVVFYNGPDNKVDEVVKLRLSDSFDIPDKSGEFEWTATMININAGKNGEIMKKCRTLKDYSIFVGKVKEKSESKSLGDAIEEAIAECIEEGVLREILVTHRKEVKNMSLTEFDEKKYLKMLKEEGREEGLEEGRRETHAKILPTLLETFQRIGFTEDQILKELTENYGYSEDVVRQHLCSRKTG